MVISIIGVILSCIILCNDRICNQIKEQPGVLFSDNLGELFLQLVIPNHLSDNDPGTDFYAAASC